MTHTPSIWQIGSPSGNGTARTIWRNNEGPNAPEDSPNTGHVTICRDVHNISDAVLISVSPEMIDMLRAAIKHMAIAGNFMSSHGQGATSMGLLCRKISKLIAQVDGVQ